MFLPLFGMLAVIILVVYFLGSKARKTDKGNHR